MGLLLFTLFFSDIPSTVNNFCSLFADDTNIHAAALYDKHNSCMTSLQEDLDRLQNWTEDMQLRFHPAKCRTKHLGKHNPNTKYTLPIDDGTLHEIGQTAEEKDSRNFISANLTTLPGSKIYGGSHTYHCQHTLAPSLGPTQILNRTLNHFSFTTTDE